MEIGDPTSSLRNKIQYLYQALSIFALYILYRYHLIDHKYQMCFFFVLYICMPILQAYLTIALSLTYRVVILTALPFFIETFASSIYHVFINFYLNFHS
jgi:hypothetical protein